MIMMILGKLNRRLILVSLLVILSHQEDFVCTTAKPKTIIETIHVKFDELKTMDSECNNLETRMNCKNFQDSSKYSQSIPSKSDLDNLFGPLYEEYYATSSQKVSDNSTANTLDNEHTSSPSSIAVEEDEALQIVSSSAEQVAIEPNSPVLNENADEFVQEDVTDLDGNVFDNAPLTIDSGFELIAYSDVDLAGCNDDFKSTSEGIHFLGDKLVSWSLKKQDRTAMSTAEAEYVSSSTCYAQVI
nr:uncharacterized mitochondrial protein AtMg00810-like [Tanacetum cinerariifolium]